MATTPPDFSFPPDLDGPIGRAAIVVTAARRTAAATGAGLSLGNQGASP